MKVPTILRQCDKCGTSYRGLKWITTEEDAQAMIEASRKAHARTKDGRACLTQVKHRKSGS